MTRLEFNPSKKPTVGVEIELALVDANTMALCSKNAAILNRIPGEYADKIKPELMQCYVEINTDVCEGVSDVEADLKPKLQVLSSAATAENVQLYWSGTHPFSTWHEQKITPNDRYMGLVNLLQDTARQLVTFGLHVHVGVNSGDKAIMICDRILRYLPVLLALSCNSPFWEGRVTGLHSWRSKVMEGLPTAGLPPLMRNWSEYVWLINHLIDTGYIESIREIWWDVRPHHRFGTVEIRICDIPGSLEDTLALVALIQCLVKDLSDQVDAGTYQHDCHPMLVRQNKWHASRYGLEARLVDSNTHDLKSVPEMVRELVAHLAPIAEGLDCRTYLDRVLDLAARPTWSQRQMDLLDRTRDPAEVVRRLSAATRLAPPPAPSAS
jgi:carboxylate-amine ligase